MSPVDVNTVCCDKNVWKAAYNGLYRFTEDLWGVLVDVDAVHIVWHVNSSYNSVEQTRTFMNSETKSDRKLLFRLLLTQEDEQNEFLKHLRNLDQAFRHAEFLSHLMRFESF